MPRISALTRALSLFMALVELTVSTAAFAGGKMSVPVTPERIEACRRLLTRKGIELPPGAQITSIEITAEDWVCTSCGHEVNGLPANFPKEVAKCDNCGSPMEPHDGELYKRNPEGKLTLRPDQIDAALDLGANWTCDYCHTGGNRDKTISGEIVKECSTCGAPRADFTDYKDKNTTTGHVKDAHKHDAVSKAKAEQVLDEQSGRADAKKVEAEIEKARAEQDKMMKGEPKAVTTVTSPESPVFEAPKPKTKIDELRQILIRNKKGVIIGGGIVMAAALFFTYETLKDKPIKGLVTYARWVQTVRVEQFQPVIERGKKGQIKESEPVMPVNGQGGTPGAKIIECTGDTCLYETYKWIEVDSKVARGTYEQPIPGNSSWANFQAPLNGRVMTNTRFDVDFSFSHNGEKYSAEWRPANYEEFRQFKPGSEITVQIDPLRNVEKISAEKGGK